MSSENNDVDLNDAIKLLMKTNKQIKDITHNDSVFGSDYYTSVNDIGLSDYNKDIGDPTRGSINRYYDEKQNPSILTPTLDPLNIYNLTERVKNSIQTNDYSESYFFSSAFDKDEISERFLEKNTLYSKRLEWYRINEIKRMQQKSEQLIAVNLLLLDKLDNILRYNIKHYILDKYESKPVGKSFYVAPTLTNGSPTTRIDFTDLGKCKNLPNNFNANNFPHTELFSIVIKVDTGGPILIGLNEPEGNLNAYIKVNLNEEYKIDNVTAFIKSINIVANGADSSVRIIGIF